METVIQFLLYLHIAAGMLALVVAPIAMIVRKGGRQHRLWGKVYFGGMTVVTVTAIIISLYRPIPFLLMVAVFSYYFIVTGYRVLYLKQRKGQQPMLLDWIISGVAATFNTGLIFWGIYSLFSGDGSAFAWIALAFGVIGLLTVAQNLRQFIKPEASREHWLLQHMGGMVGGYIATVSAFSAVNFDFLPTLLRWLWPTLIGLPLLNIWTRSYKKKLSKGRRAEELVTVEAGVVHTEM